MLETHWTGKTTKKRQNFDTSAPPSPHIAPPHHGIQRNQALAPNLLGRSTDEQIKWHMLLPQPPLGKISIVPWPTEKNKNKNKKLHNKQATGKKDM
jgi:hypothetical protein